MEFAAAKSTAANGMQFVVARYYPAGNMMRKFAENVFPLEVHEPSKPETLPAPKQKTLTVRLRNKKASRVKRPKSLFTYADNPRFSSDEEEG